MFECLEDFYRDAIGWQKVEVILNCNKLLSK